ncbi:DUF6551 family protein [Hungatella hathewayi]|uniref:DUF6551 family protein n=1 Tax=Hungatella hathewayi TaxID=154046 RepID=UPI003563DAB3
MVMNKYVPNVHFEQIRIKDLVSNQDYQRNISIGHVKKASENFNLYQINPVKVSRRDGINYVFNGQHTIEIVARVSGSRETPVWCMIYDDLAYKQEANIFAEQQTYVKPLLPYETFMAHIEAGNPKYLLIKSLVESYNLSLSPGGTHTGISAVSTLVSIHDKYGIKILDHVLQLIILTWEGVYMSFSANMLNGIARLISTYGDQLIDEVFIERCGKASIKEISRTAKERRDGSLGFSETLLLLYNKRTRNSLSFEALYTHKKARYCEKNPKEINQIIENNEIIDRMDAHKESEVTTSDILPSTELNNSDSSQNPSLYAVI